MAGRHYSTGEQTALSSGAVLTTLRGQSPAQPSLCWAVSTATRTRACSPCVASCVTSTTPTAPAPSEPSHRPTRRRGQRTADSAPSTTATSPVVSPGDRANGPTPALACDLTEQVIAGSDLLIDLHSAGMRYRMPLFWCFARDGDQAGASQRAAEVFGAPLIWAHPATVPGRSLTVAAERGIPAIYAECSGGGSIRRHELDAYVDGALSVMTDLGMFPDSSLRNPRCDSLWVNGAGDLDEGAQAQRHGFFVSSTSAGAQVDEGGELGQFYDYQGRRLHDVLAPRPDVVMFLRRQPRTRIGDILFVLADLKDPQE